MNLSKLQKAYKRRIGKSVKKGEKHTKKKLVIKELNRNKDAVKAT